MKKILSKGWYNLAIGMGKFVTKNTITLQIVLAIALIALLVCEFIAHMPH
jgi:hypothetical protein